MALAVFFAFGTRGDVQPIALIAKLLAIRRHRVRFITHRVHAEWLAGLFDGDTGVPTIDLIWVDTPAIASPEDGDPRDLWSQEQQRKCFEAIYGSESMNKHENSDDGVKLIAFNLFSFEGLILADLTGIPAVALHPYPPPSTFQSVTGGALEQEGGRQALVERLEEEWPWLCDHLTLASAQQSNDFVDTAALDGCPGISARGTAGCRDEGTSNMCTTALTLEEFKHWVWPVVASPHWQAFRRTTSAILRARRRKKRRNNSAAVHQEQREVFFNCRQAAALSTIHHRAPFLLYGHAPLLLPRPTTWPRRVIDTGAWVFTTARASAQFTASLDPPALGSKTQGQQQKCQHALPEVVSLFLRGNGSRSNGADDSPTAAESISSPLLHCSEDRKVVYVNLGSAWRSLVDASACQEFADSILHSAVVEFSRRVIVHLPTRRDTAVRDCHESRKEEGEEDEESKELLVLRSAFQRAETRILDDGKQDSSLPRGVETSQQNCSEDWILLWDGGALPHGPFFASWCCCVLHHGGSGTCLAAASAGVPQICAPFFFDQFMWARQVVILGIGASVLSSSGSENEGISKVQSYDDDSTNSNLSLSVLQRCFSTALAPACRLRAACFGKKLRDSMRSKDMLLSSSAAAGVRQDEGEGGTCDFVCSDAVSHVPVEFDAEREGFSLGVAKAVEHLELILDTEVVICSDSGLDECGISGWQEFLVNDTGTPSIERNQEKPEGINGDCKFEAETVEDSLAKNEIHGEALLWSRSLMNSEDGEEHDELELPNRLWVESLGHEETAFLYHEIFECEDYAGPRQRPADNLGVSEKGRSGGDEGKGSGGCGRKEYADTFFTQRSNLFLEGLLSQLLSSEFGDSVVVDVGANIGLFAIWLQQHAARRQLKDVRESHLKSKAAATPAETTAYTPVVRPGLSPLFRLLCIEPAPLTCNALRRNLSRHAPHAEVAQLAIVRSVISRDGDGAPDPAATPVAAQEACKEPKMQQEHHHQDLLVGLAEIWFLPQLPGNSCLLQYKNERHGNRHESGQFLRDGHQSLEKKRIQHPTVDENEFDTSALSNQAFAMLGENPTKDRRALVKRLYGGGQRLTVRTTTLKLLLQAAGVIPLGGRSDVLSKGKRVALLKVDVEGAELDVLEGFGGVDEWQYVDRVVAEVHDIVRGESDSDDGKELSHESRQDIFGFSAREASSSASCNIHQAAEISEGRRAIIDRLLRHRAGFPHVFWERPTAACGHTKTTTTLDNWTVFASRTAPC